MTKTVKSERNCSWCGSEIVEDEKTSSSIGVVHIDCAPEVAMEDRASSYQDQEQDYDYY